MVCPKRVRSISFFKSLLDKDLKTDSASMVKVTLMLRPPNPSMSFNWVGVSGPAWSSCRVSIVGLQSSNLGAAASLSAEYLERACKR
eukprot:4863715-Pyramimonas_sp.AAC.1